MRKNEMTLRMDLTSHQLRGFTALTRCLGPLDIERIAVESGEAECILSALDQLQCALSCEGAVDANRTGIYPLPIPGRARKQTLQGLEVILRGGGARGEIKDKR